MSNGALSQEKKAKGYYENVRREILPLLPHHMPRVLEVGCGVGATLSFLKSLGKCAWVGGIESFHDAADVAREKLDFLLEGNIETIDLPIEHDSIDVILCLDVLEHLTNPWVVIRRLHNLLKPGGFLICSVPNVRNFRVVLPLLFFGRWSYSEFGLLDRTHLRFFTRATAIELLECSGLVVDKVRSTGLEGKAALANWITLSVMKPLFEFQYLLRAVKN